MIRVLSLILMTLSYGTFAIAADKNKTEEKATFAGGCFWCIEKPFEVIPGVKSAISGYTGGKEKNPRYRQVANGSTSHLEAVQITFDPKQVSYSDLLEVFWRQIDPTDPGGQFVDRGPHYRTAIFPHSIDQEKIAKASLQRLDKSSRFPKPIVTEILPFKKFYVAELYHQDYYKTNPDHYKRYRRGSSRDRFITKYWGSQKTYLPKSRTSSLKKGSKFMKPSKDELKKTLSPIQFKVTQQDGTERPFKNEYWDNKEAGIYVDIVSNEPLFSSTTKFKSGTGWPSFYAPIDKETIVEKSDRKLFMKRTEVRSKLGDSHLGHLFNDGPAPTGLRYCINSASLRFIPKEKLASEGFERYLKLFE